MTKVPSPKFPFAPAVKRISFIFVRLIEFAAILSAFKVPVFIFEASKFVILTLFAFKVPVVILSPAIVVLPLEPRSEACKGSYPRAVL